jgi:sulfatase modifying factor 1
LKHIIILIMMTNLFSYISGNDINIQYDSRNQVSLVQYNSGYSISFNYDSHGNLISQVVTVPNTTPLSPNQFTITYNGNSIMLTWAPVTHDINGNPIIVTSYKIESSNNPYSGFVLIGSTTQTSYTDTSISTQKRFYRIKAVIGSIDNVVFVQGGTFTMGDTHNFGLYGALPLHEVTLSSYYISKFEVTQGDWISVMSNNPSVYQGDINRPVETVSWYDCIAFCNKKSIQDGYIPCYTYIGYGTNPLNWPSGWNTSLHNNILCNWNTNGYRLPSEAEWEFAARGGIYSHDYVYSGSDNINEVAWWEGNSAYHTNPVGQKLPNELGLYDLTGNIHERVWDWWAFYTSEAQINPHGPNDGQERVRKGNSFVDVDYNMPVPARGSAPPYSTETFYSNVGFRIARSQ